MATSSISGLVSGMDTATIISQLMQLESQPQTLLKSKLSTEKSVVTALQALNTKLASLATKAADLAKTTSWSPVAATSSSDKVAVTAAATAQPGTLSFTVVQTARAHQLTFSEPAPATGSITTGSAILINGTSYDVGSGSLDEVVGAINRSGEGVTASTVRLDDGTFRLRITASETGAGSSFTITNDDAGQSALLGGAAVTAGQDAAITVGADTLHSSSNTFSGVSAGLTLTLASGTPTGTAVDVTVTRDTKAATAAVKGLVDAANEILAEITKLTAYDVTTKKGAALVGDSTLRALRSEIMNTVAGSADGRSLVGIGVQVDRYGKITLDETAFAAAYAADPANVASLMGSTSTWQSGNGGTASLVSAGWKVSGGTYAVDATPGASMLGGFAATANGTLLAGGKGTTVEGLVVDAASGAQGTITYIPGFAARLETVLKRASDATSGLVTSAVKGRQSSVSDMETAIAKWDDRLAMRRSTLDRQFTALETALGKLQSQSSWLAGQINSLPSWNNQ